MSWGKANAAGAKDPKHGKKTEFGKCQMSGCNKAATVQYGRLRLCRSCAGEMD